MTKLLRIMQGTLALGLLTAPCAVTAQTNLVTNGTFAAPTLGLTGQTGSAATASTELGNFTFNSAAYSSSLNGWTINGGNAYDLWFVENNATTQTAFSRYDSYSSSAPGYTGNEMFRAVPGTDGSNPNFVALDGDSGVQGGLYQTLTGLTVGTVYKLTFDSAAAQLTTGNNAYSSTLYYNLGTSSTINTATAGFVQAMSGGSTTIPQGGTSAWTTHTVYLEASAATEYLSFLAYGPSGGPPMALLDDVSMVAAPEPSTLALLGTGLALVIGRRARGRRKAGLLF